MRVYLINDETGEILDDYSLSNLSKKASLKVNRAIVEEMINNAGNDITKIDLPMLYSWCKMCKDISDFNQMKINGIFQDDKMFRVIISMNFGLHILRCLETANKYSCFMKRNHNQFIENWKQLFETVEITKRDTQQKVKKFLLDNKLVREYKHIGRDGKQKTKFIVNPFVYRRSTYVGEIAISQFQDFIKEGENMSTYLIRLLQGKEVIDFKVEV